MSKSMNMNMLRTRRRDNNVKPNRRLDRKSSRGMIYENEELRLKTININAEIERGQSDIKKLRRENEMLKKEIWCLRDEYEKLDKLLKEKDVDFSSSSTTCTSDSASCSSEDEGDEVETSQNLENVQKTNQKNLHVEFDHLSIVPEENSTENSDTRGSIPNENDLNIIKPDQSYPSYPPKLHFFSPLPQNVETFQQVEALAKSSSDIIVKTDNTDVRGSFSNGGNLEELLNDIETISQDILKMSEPDEPQTPYKSELNVVLMPTPMPLLGFEKYHLPETPYFPTIPQFDNAEYYDEALNLQGFNVQPTPPNITPVKPDDVCSSRSNLLEVTSSDHISSENEADKTKREKQPKMSIRKKVSIHFKGKKDKKVEDPVPHCSHKKTPSLDSHSEDLSKHNSLEVKTSGSERNSLNLKQRKSSSVSPDRKHVTMQDAKKHRKHKKPEKLQQRRSTISTDRARERSFSVCTDRSNNAPLDDYFTSDRERTNSVSSCGTVRQRKMSNLSNFPISGKIPWCGCWGNGCV